MRERADMMIGMREWGGGRERDLRVASEGINDDDEGDVGAAAGVALHVEECDVVRCLACV